MSQGLWSLLGCTSSLHSVKWCNYPISGSGSVGMCQCKHHNDHNPIHSLPEHSPWKMVVGQLFCWEGLFSAYMLVSGKVSLANLFKSFSRVNLKTPHQVHKSLTFDGETLKITQSRTSSSRWFQPICKIFTGFGVTPKKPLKPPNLIRLCSFLPWYLLFHPIETSTLSGFIYINV